MGWSLYDHVICYFRVEFSIQPASYQPHCFSGPLYYHKPGEILPY